MMLSSSEQDVQQFSFSFVEEQGCVEGFDCPISLCTSISTPSLKGEVFPQSLCSLTVQNLRPGGLALDNELYRLPGPSGLVSLLAVVGQGECSLKHLDNNVSGVGARVTALPMTRLPENWGFVARVEGSIPSHPILFQHVGAADVFCRIFDCSKPLTLRNNYSLESNTAFQHQFQHVGGEMLEVA